MKSIKMKLKDVLIALFGLQLIINLYYLPQNIKFISNIIENGSFNNVSYMFNTLLLYLMLILGVIGVVKYLPNKNIFNPFLKAFFIYDFFSFISNIPNNIHYATSDYVSDL